MAISSLGGAFAERNFRLYTVGFLLSWLTFFLQFMAVNWLAWNLTHAFGVPAQFGLLPRVVTTANLPTAIAIASAYRTLAMLMGPALAGVMLARFHVSTAFFVNVAGYAIYVAMLLRMRLPPAPACSRADAPCTATSWRG